MSSSGFTFCQVRLSMLISTELLLPSALCVALAQEESVHIRHAA